ncbi:MAG: histidine phosphatase family protein [Desulfobacterales bacterium]|jgi:broad specificity phosphatase PhoE
MSEIYFIRHGQASFGEENYDRLSALGVRQAKYLAKHLAKTGKLFDAVYQGELERQQNTAREFISHYASKGIDVVAPIVTEAFNEYDSFTIWQALIPEMLADNPAVAQELEKIPADQNAFQRIFAPLMTRWVTGQYRARGVPRWDEFTHCVKQGVAELITRHGANKRLVVFTSGGPISVTVQSALGLSDKKTLEISWQILNTSITRIKYNSHGMMLAGFNDVTHLELEGDEGLITYR